MASPRCAAAGSRAGEHRVSGRAEWIAGDPAAAGEPGDVQRVLVRAHAGVLLLDRQPASLESDRVIGVVAHHARDLRPQVLEHQLVGQLRAAEPVDPRGDVGSRQQARCHACGERAVRNYR